MIKSDSKAEVKPFSARFTKAQNGGSSSSPTKQPQNTKILPPFTSLCLLPNEIGFNLMKKQNEVVVSDLIKTPSMILVDAGSLKVQSRLYGGFHPDWVCGGEWTNSSSFVSCINKFCKDKKHKLIVAFDASIDHNNLNSWLAKMEWDYENIKEVFNIVANTGHPPCASTKRVAALWFPPTALQTTLRLICLALGIKMHCTLYEHEPELVAVPNVKDPLSKGLMDEVGVFFTSSLEFLCYTDLNVANLLWGESLKLNMRGDRMTGKRIDRDDVAVTLGISNESLDAGLLYYGTRYFLDYSNTEKSKALQEMDEEKRAGRPEFDPTEDLHHEMLAALTPEDSKPERRLKQALSIMRQVHQDGINKKSSLNVGESLLPSIEHIVRCVTDGNPLPPDFEDLTREDDRPKIESVLKRVRNRAEDAFFEIGSRLIEGRIQSPPEPYFKEGKRVVFPHQTRFGDSFLVHLEKSHKSGHIHEWIGQLVFAQEPTIRLPYTMADRGRVIMKLKEEPKMFFRELRRRAYGLLFANTGNDFTSDTAPHTVYVREIDYAGVEIVSPCALSLDIAQVTQSSEALWGSKDSVKSLYVLLNIVLGAGLPRNWEQMFSRIPEICWVPVIALRYMLNRCPALFATTDYVDALLATVASVATTRILNPSKTILSDYDRTANDPELIMTVGSVTFVSYFMTAVDHIIFANDVAQQAIPLASVSPVQFFDGNVFHTFLELRKRNTILEGLLGAPDKKLEIFIKARHVVLSDYQDTDVLSQLLWPREDTADRLLHGRVITPNMLERPVTLGRRGEQTQPKRNWDDVGDSPMPLADQRTGALPNPYGFQPLAAQPAPPMAQPMYVDQTFSRGPGPFYH